jgi:hypothetical protein
MIDYTQWTPKKAKVSSLLLDPENPRIPPADHPLSQDELLAELIEHDKVYELAKNIVTNGYYTDEMLITAARDGKCVVVEGNRRLAALKALLSPEAAPEKHQKKFRALSAKIPRSMIHEIPTILAPSRDAALPRIAEKHTHPMLESWKTPQQARFYQSLLEQGKTAVEICESHGLTRSELEDFLRMATLYRMACSLDLPEDVQEKVENPRSFPITTLERLLELQPGREFLCIEADPKHGFKGNVQLSEFKKGFAKVVTDVAKGEVDSRVLRDKESIRRYLATIKDHQPDKSKRGSFSAKDLFKKTARPPSPGPAKQARTKGYRPSSRLVPGELKCSVNSQRVHDVFNEFRKMKLPECPNAIAIMLRVLLELSASHYIQRIGKTNELITRYRQPHAKSDWHATLRQQTTFLLQEVNLPLEPLERRGLQRFLSDKDTWFNLDSLDTFIHNKNVQPTERDLRSIWGMVEPLFRIILTEPK